MHQLVVQEIARSRGIKLADLIREAKLAERAVARYWYRSQTGRQKDAGTLDHVRLSELEMIADILEVPFHELFVEE